MTRAHKLLANTRTERCCHWARGPFGRQGGSAGGSYSAQGVLRQDGFPSVLWPAGYPAWSQRQRESLWLCFVFLCSFGLGFCWFEEVHPRFFIMSLGNSDSISWWHYLHHSHCCSQEEGFMCYHESADGRLFLLSTLLMHCGRAKNEQLSLSVLSPRSIEWTPIVQCLKCCEGSYFREKTSLSDRCGTPRSQALHCVTLEPLLRLGWNQPQSWGMCRMWKCRESWPCSHCKGRLYNVSACFGALANTSWIS